MSAATGHSARTLTVRVPNPVQSDLALLSRATGTSISEHVRAAVSLYIFERIMSDSLDDEITAAKARFSTYLDDTLVTEDSLVKNLSPTSASTGTKEDTKAEAPLSIRLGPVDESRLKGLALLDDNSLADQLRRALDAYLEQEKNQEIYATSRESLERIERDLNELLPKPDSVSEGPALRRRDKQSKKDEEAQDLLYGTSTFYAIDAHVMGT